MSEGRAKTPKSPTPMKPAFRLWMEDIKKDVMFDQTDAVLLRRIDETHSLTQAAKEVGISYRNAWDRVHAMEDRLHRKLVKTKVGGRTGGGAALTEDGSRLLSDFRRTRKLLFNVLDDREAWEDVGYTLSARNKLRAKVVEVKRGAVTSQVKMRLLAPETLTSVITNEAVDELSLEEGDTVDAVVKATDVLVAKERRPESRGAAQTRLEAPAP